MIEINIDGFRNGRYINSDTTNFEFNLKAS